MKDPLDGADVGETARVKRVVKMRTANVAPRVFIGEDRMYDADVTDVTVDGDFVFLTFNGEVTKRLPPRWDYHAEPVTEAEKRAARKRELAQTIGAALGIVVPAFITMLVAYNVMGTLTDISINGTPVEQPSLVFYLVFTGMVLTFAWAMKELLIRRA